MKKWIKKQLALIFMTHFCFKGHCKTGDFIKKYLTPSLSPREVIIRKLL